MLDRVAGQHLDDVEYDAMMRAAVAQLDRRAKVVIRPDLRVLWRSPNADRLLVAPSPVVLAGDRLRFPSSNQVNGAIAVLDGVDETPSRHLLRAAAKGHWALLQAWQLPVRHRAIALVCT